MRRRVASSCLFLCVLGGPVFAQQLDRFVGFGASDLDTGWFANTSTGDPARDKALKDAGHGARPVDGSGLRTPEFLANSFGISGAAPANDPNSPGSNYAAFGARIDEPNAPGSGFALFTTAPSITAQILQYLADSGGVADRNALYLVGVGDNDVAYAANQNRTDGVHPIFSLTDLTEGNKYIATQALAAASDIAMLQRAGARYIIVPDQLESFPPTGGVADDAEKEYRHVFNTTLYGKLVGDGVNFIPADYNAVRLAILNDFKANSPSGERSSFGFDFITPGNNDPTHVACPQPASGPFQTGGFSLVCTNPNDKAERFLFADFVHYSSAGEKIFADYEYGLVLAPSQLSLLAETAVKARLGLVSSIQTQIEATKQQPAGSSGINLWATGDVSHLQTDNAPGFAESTSTPTALTAGLSLRSGALIFGAALSAGHLTADFGGNRGHYDEDELAGSAYAAFAGGPFWGTVIGTWGRLDYDVNRLVPVGITIQSNTGSTDGSNASVAVQTGLDYKTGMLTQGPVAGVTLQRLDVHGFSETSAMQFTDLTFDSQTRDSAITALGWRAALEWGAFRPFAQLVWNHELAGDRDVTASLNSLVRLGEISPKYHLPAVDLGRDWGTATLGSTVILAPGVTGLASFSVDAGQGNATSYGGQLGINVAF